MITVEALDATAQLPALLDAVENGKTVLITRQGRPVARLVPVRSAVDPEATVAAIRAARKGVRLGGLSLREFTDEGRRA